MISVQVIGFRFRRPQVRLLPGAPQCHRLKIGNSSLGNRKPKIFEVHG